MTYFFLKRRRLLLVISGVIVVFIMYQQSVVMFDLRKTKLQRPHDINRIIDRSALVDDATRNCHIPILDPFDNLISDYLRVANPIVCKWKQPLLTLIKDGILQFNQSALDESGYSPSSLSCYYQPIIRPNGQDDVTNYGPKQQMTGKDVIKDDFVYVYCDNRWYFTVYTNIHAHLRDLHPKPITRQGDSHKLSVLAFGVDSLSHMNAIRYLPKTYRYLTQSMGAHVMHGMTRVGDNTWPNTIPILTGKRVYSNPEEIKTLPLGEYYDDYSLIWKNFSKNNQYVTLLAEDWPEYTIFNQVASGFFKQPTDHYFRPFWVAVESSFKYKWSSYMCYGECPKHLHQLRYIRDFLMKYRNIPYFAFTIMGEIGHDDMALATEADDDFTTVLHELQSGGYLNDTIIFFFGDHGQRFDPIILTELGRIDSNLPFSAIVLPPSIRTKFPEVDQMLRSNSNQLTSMYDYYETFVDILHYVEGKTLLGKHQLTESPSLSRRSYSLFAKIPLNRTCENAGVPFRYCPCVMAQTGLPVNNKYAKMAANVLLSELNTIISNYTNKCSLWTLSQIKSAFSLLNDPYAASLDIRVTIETNPGNALFEALVRLTKSPNKEVNRVIEEINRVNRYKGQDICLISDVHKVSRVDIRKYCYCL